MTDLDPSPYRVALALRAATRKWAIGPDGPLEVNRSREHIEMVRAGLVRPAFDPRQRPGESIWELTSSGENWLIGHLTGVIGQLLRLKVGPSNDAAAIAPRLSDALKQELGVTVPAIALWEPIEMARRPDARSLAHAFVTALRT